MYIKTITSALRPEESRKYSRKSLFGRQAQLDKQSSATVRNVSIILAVVVVCIIAIVLFISCLYIRRRRKQTGIVGKQNFIGRKWQAWSSRNKYSQVNPRDRARELSETGTAYRGNTMETEERRADQTIAAGVDRNTSIRSIITLPPYSQAPKETEQVIGREGERAGMDTVVEFPENAEEEETHREEDMEGLYQIRLARRREVAEREERRRQRREARERGDWARLEEIRRESRARASTQDPNTSGNGNQSVSAATLLAEHQSRGRDRRVSEVSYGSLGNVRHDGTRLRANSNDSERGGLLDDVAPMGNLENGSTTAFEGGFTPQSTSRPTTSRARGQSNSSMMSTSTGGSDPVEITQMTPTSTQPSDTRPPSGSNNDSGTTNSSPRVNRFTPDESTGSDIGESRIPISSAEEQIVHHQPPNYEFLEWGDAPAYETHHPSHSAERDGHGRRQNTTGRRSSQPPQLPRLNLPRINVEDATEPNTPITPSTSGITSNEHP